MLGNLGCDFKGFNYKSCFGIGLIGIAAWNRRYEIGDGEVKIKPAVLC